MNRAPWIAKRSGCVWSAFGAGLGDDRAGSLRGWVAVAEVESLSVQFLDPGQRFVCLVGGGVGGRGGEVRAGLSGDDVEVVDGVSDEQRVLEWGVEGAVALGMPGGVNDSQSSWHVELVAVVERDDLRDFGLLGSSVGDHVAQRATAV